MIPMAEVRLTMEEYLSLIDQSSNRKQIAPSGTTYKTSVKKKRKGTPLKGMDSALAKANAMGRKKSGGFKKGWSQGKIMSKAHQIRRRSK